MGVRFPPLELMGQRVMVTGRASKTRRQGSIPCWPANLPVAQRIVQLATNQEVVRSNRTGEANCRCSSKVERLFRKQQGWGSIPLGGSTIGNAHFKVGPRSLQQRPDRVRAGRGRLGWRTPIMVCGCSLNGETLAFQAGSGRFDPGHPLCMSPSY